MIFMWWGCGSVKIALHRTRICRKVLVLDFKEPKAFSWFYSCDFAKCGSVRIFHFRIVRCGAVQSRFFLESYGAVRFRYRTDLPVHEVTVSVDEGTGKSVFIGREN